MVPYERVNNHTMESVSGRNMTQLTWKSPVPYLFGGVAAMLALIAVALLILACSYWKMSGHFDTIPHTVNRQIDDDDTSFKNKSGVDPKHGDADHDDKVIVIMAGQDKPTYLAKPSHLLQVDASLV